MPRKTLSPSGATATLQPASDQVSPPLGAEQLMLATLTRKPFNREGWLFELKYDGFRLMILREQGKVRLLSRQGKSLDASFPEVITALEAQLSADCVLDAELTVCDAQGKPRFERLLSRASTRSRLKVPAAARADPATVFAFDILRYEDRDLRKLSLADRKGWLRESFSDSPRLVYASGVHTAGEWVFSQVTELGLEGMVAKNMAAKYVAGYSPDWLKVKLSTYYRQAALGLRT